MTIATQRPSLAVAATASDNMRKILVKAYFSCHKNTMLISDHHLTNMKSCICVHFNITSLQGPFFSVCFRLELVSEFRTASIISDMWRAASVGLHASLPCFLVLRPYTGHSDQTPAMNRPIYSIYFEHIIPSRRSKYRFSDVEHEILPCELSYGLLKLQSNRTFIYYMKERLFNIATLLWTKGFSQHDDCMIPSCLVRNFSMF